MAWGFAEFDAERRGKKEDYSAGLSDCISQGICFSTSKNRNS